MTAEKQEILTMWECAFNVRVRNTLDKMMKENSRPLIHMHLVNIQDQLVGPDLLSSVFIYCFHCSY